MGWFKRLFGLENSNTSKHDDMDYDSTYTKVENTYDPVKNNHVETILGVRLDAEPMDILIDGFKDQNKENFIRELENNTGRQAISLKKHFICLDKTINSLSGMCNVDFSVHRAKVACIMDKSGSLHNDYREGIIQEIILKIMPIALKFDDNGECDFWAFSDKTKRIEGLTLDNFENYIEDIVDRVFPDYGGTNFAPPLVDAYKKYCIEEPSRLPVYIIFITDGDNYDKDETNRIIRELSKHNVFIKFIGTGDSSTFDYLDNMKNLSGKETNNTDFFSAKSIVSMNDETLYKNILRGYPEWLLERAARNKNH